MRASLIVVAVCLQITIGSDWIPIPSRRNSRQQPRVPRKADHPVIYSDNAPTYLAQTYFNPDNSFSVPAQQDPVPLKPTILNLHTTNPHQDHQNLPITLLHRQYHAGQ